MVNRELQFGLAWRMMIAYLLFLFIGIALMFAPSMLRLATGSKIEELAPAAREFLILHNRIWPAVLVTLAGVFLYTLFISHRIAGPIYRINATLKKMQEGEYPDKVSLRNGDFFHETAELLQDLSRKLAAEQGKK
jgi:signal transduction histidine kinase